MLHPIQSELDPQFEEAYVAYLQSKVSPEDAAPFIEGIKLNIRPWEYSKAFYNAEISAEDKVLDTGSMHTFFCVYLSKFVKAVRATDSYSWALRDYASRLPSPQKWEDVVTKAGEGKIIAEHADLQNLQYENNYFDKVFCISTIEHVHDDKKAMNEMFRVLKPGGLLLLSSEYNHVHSMEYINHMFMRIYNHQTFETLISDFKYEELLTTIPADTIPAGQFTQIFSKLRKS